MKNLPNSVLSALSLILIIGGLAVSLAGVGQAQGPPDEAVDETEALIEALLQQGVEPECIQGIDPNGIPLICETGGHKEQIKSPQPPAAAAALPVGTRGWEPIPGVIRNDGLETFRLEVDTNGPVLRVTLATVSAALIAPEATPVQLRDDGLGQDQVAGDCVYTAGPFRQN